MSYRGTHFGKIYLNLRYISNTITATCRVKPNKVVDKLNKNIYTEERWRDYTVMTTSDQIRVLCARLNISMAELARRMGQSPQSLSGKMSRESFSISDMEKVAEAAGISFVRKFVFPNGEEI